MTGAPRVANSRIGELRSVRGYNVYSMDRDYAEVLLTETYLDLGEQLISFF